MTTETRARTRDEKDSRYLTHANEIEACFKGFRDQRTLLSLRLDGHLESLTCRVLDVDAGRILVEDINPRSAMSELRKGATFSVSVRSPGLYAFVDGMRIVGESQERGLPYFIVPMPTSMLFQQRRRNARYRIPLRISTADASITLNRATPMAGRLIDVSAGGCRAAFSPPIAQPIAFEETIANCTISLPPTLEVHSEVVVRHTHEQKDGTVVCGLELTRMNVTDRRRLEQFIQSLSRNVEPD